MEKSTKRNRERFGNMLKERYSNRQKENEIKLFENIKTDISMIISEHLKKRSKTEFELTTIEKKYIYLKSISEELEKLLKQGDVDVKNNEQLINNYFEYTTTNLDYIFIKYESIITDMSETNEDMKLRLKNIKEKELVDFQNSYESVKEKANKLNEMKHNIINIKNKLTQLKEENEHIKNEIDLKKKEEVDIEKKYKELLLQIEEYKKEFQSVKENCNIQMNEKKQSSINLSTIEEKMGKIKTEIQKLFLEKKNVTSELSTLREDNTNILKNMFDYNTNLNVKCENLILEIKSLEKELQCMKSEKELLHESYQMLEVKLNDVTKICDEKKKEVEQMSSIVKRLSDELILEKNSLKEKEKECSCLNDEYNLLKKENLYLVEKHNSVEKELEKINNSILDYKNIFEVKKNELVDIELMKEKNEKTKFEILNFIENSEKLLLEQKNFFFKISKFLNLINLSNEECISLQNERNLQKENNSTQQNYEQVHTDFGNLCNDVKGKIILEKKLQNDINSSRRNIHKKEEEIQAFQESKKTLEQNLQNIIQKKETYEKEMENRQNNSEHKIKETTDMLKEKYEQLAESLASQLKTKHVEHNNFLKHGEKEKLEYDFQIFKSDIISSLEKERVEKKKKIIEIDMELKIYQQKYSSIKAV
ncbi:hypothetical protein MKS88_005878 [Plasmodium brasilianum]|uniref:Uncharacterized protein n=2 Tax=Plasmodium (Plasmodium) TaxID=418103 RepID=A0A1A8WHZ8_PLAMA|nr:conserved Plasmodium protein, unknown function [Plasmodium malariae]KAI4835191.1 hypothetical protein MKS88_005878 [Plasmodium brasilianum]SBS91452.1 hypothetical protein PMALA_033040 [Plasmodium malariae]SCP03775.1 conserved Plasmodium protein, unknown function [Plasmodium malariae]